MGIVDADDAAIPQAWKRDEVALHRFVEVALWIGRTGTPWCASSQALSLWPNMYHRWRRWCVCNWWELVCEAMRPALPGEGLVLLDGATCSARRAQYCGGRGARTQPWRYLLQASCLR